MLRRGRQGRVSLLSEEAGSASDRREGMSGSPCSDSSSSPASSSSSDSASSSQGASTDSVESRGSAPAPSEVVRVGRRGGHGGVRIDTAIPCKTAKFAEVKAVVGGETACVGYEVTYYLHRGSGRCTRTLAFARHGGRELTIRKLKWWVVEGFCVEDKSCHGPPVSAGRRDADLGGNRWHRGARRAPRCLALSRCNLNPTCRTCAASRRTLSADLCCQRPLWRLPMGPLADDRQNCPRMRAGEVRGSEVGHRWARRDVQRLKGKAR